MDIFPTTLELLGIELPGPIDGRSLLPVLRGDRTRSGDAETVLLHQSAWKGRYEGRAISNSRYKLIDTVRSYERLGPSLRLYDVVRDPNEQSDIAAEFPEVLARMRSELDRRFEAFDDSGPEPENALSEMNEERLRALGYID
jgi:arylsulfatase A-like enzyme